MVSRHSLPRLISRLRIGAYLARSIISLAVFSLDVTISPMRTECSYGPSDHIPRVWVRRECGKRRSGYHARCRGNPHRLRRGRTATVAIAGTGMIFGLVAANRTPSQIFASLMFDPVPFLRHRRRFPHEPSVPLLQSRIFGFDELTPQSVWSRAGKTTAYQTTRETFDRKASIGTCKAADLSE
jgi:hypothetical protein